MTVQEVIDAALARVAEYGISFPASNASYVRRINRRQQELFALANQANPDYFGVCATVPIPAGGADLKTITPPVYSADLISRIEIHDPGTSAYAVDEPINIVSFDEKDAAFPPRVTLRDMTIRQVGTDLEGVTEIEVYYSKVPLPLPFDNPDYEIEFTPHFQDLLVLDLAKNTLRRAGKIMGTDQGGPIADIESEENPLLATFAEHVKRFAGGQIQRFAVRTSQAAP